VSWIELYRTLAGFGEPLRVGGAEHGNTTTCRQGKRPAFSAAYVVGKIDEFTNVTSTRCWRFLQIVQAFQGFERRRLELLSGATP